MQSPVAFVFFAFFALILFVMYILIRRHIGSTVLVAAGGVIGSMISMMLFTLAQGNTVGWAILIGIAVGGVFSAGALVLASYFAGSDARKATFNPYAPPEDDGTR